jgi:hypothetical protein
LKIFIFILFYTLIINADDISRLINKIKSINSGNEKRILINRLKIKLRTKSNKKRLEIMHTLRKAHKYRFKNHSNKKHKGKQRHKNTPKYQNKKTNR